MTTALKQGTREDRDAGLRPSSADRDLGIFPIPQRLQHNPEKPAEFSPLLGITFALASTFSKWHLGVGCS